MFAVPDTQPTPRLVCEFAAQSIGAVYGLDHAFSCPDVQSVLTDRGDRSFTDEDVPCGEVEPRTCFCGGETQNSHQALLEMLGPS